MQPAEDKMNFHISLTTTQQPSCSYKNVDCQIKDELLEQPEEDPLKIEIKEEPYHPDDVSGDSDTRLGDDVLSITAADTKTEHVRLVEREVAGAIRRKRGVPATWTRSPVDRAAGGAGFRTNEEDHPAIKMARALDLVEASDISDEEAEDLNATNPRHVQRRIRNSRTGEVRREYSAHSSHLPSALVTEANVSTSMDIARVQAPTVPSASNIQAEVVSSVADDVRPSTSGLAATFESVPREEMDEGSDLDSDSEDEFNRVPERVDFAWNIPDDEEMEELIRDNIHALEREIDEEFERLAGTSTSYEWVEGFDTFRGRRQEFTGPAPGPVKDYDTPYEAFTDIWGKDFIGRVVLETNRYAKQTIDSKTAKGQLASQSRLRKWTDTDVDEIYRLFAVYIYMSICQRTSIDEYWKTTNVLDMPKFRNLMSFNRYTLLNKFLHFVDNMDASPTLRQDDGLLLSKRVLKLAPVIIHLNSKFSSLYQLSPDICIDETLTLFKGRLSWVQAIRSKAARFGIKSYDLCESKSGYLYKFQIYSGKNSESSDTAAVSSDLAHKSTKVVLDLLKGLEHRGHHLTMDNFYNCPALSRYLKSLGFDSLGTLRPTRRNVPNAIAKVSKNVAKGTIVARHCGDVSIVAWKDSKVVTIISTYHTDETYVGSRSGKVLVKPVCVRDYNRTMGGVDLMDQKLSMYLVERKRGVKWYMKMFKRLLNISIHNAFVMFTSSLERRNKPMMTHRAFRYALADSLIKRHGHVSLGEVSQPVEVCLRLNKSITHTPEKMHARVGRGRCVICFRQDKDKKVCTRCRQCETFLCFGDCWYEWHTLTVLKGRERISRKRTKRT